MLKMTSLNTGGFQSTKETLIEQIAWENGIKIVLIQETHRGQNMKLPKIPGLELILESPHPKHVRAFFIEGLNYERTISLKRGDYFEAISVRLKYVAVTSVYKPLTPPSPILSNLHPENPPMQYWATSFSLARYEDTEKKT